MSLDPSPAHICTRRRAKYAILVVSAFVLATNNWGEAGGLECLVGLSSRCNGKSTRILQGASYAFVTHHQVEKTFLWRWNSRKGNTTH